MLNVFMFTNSDPYLEEISPTFISDASSGFPSSTVDRTCTCRAAALQSVDAPFPMTLMYTWRRIKTDLFAN